MKLSEIPPGMPILIEWVDAEGEDGWTNNKKFDAIMALPLKPVSTVAIFHGYVPDSHIAVAGSRSENQTMHGLAIPLGWIKRVDLLGVDPTKPVEIE